LGVAGVILADQVKSLDWRRRNAAVIEALPRETVSDVLHKVRLLLTPSEAA
jgi:mRNA interferase MazF